MTLHHALDTALRAVVTATVLAERAARRGRALSLRIATLRNALDHEPEWRVQGDELYEGGRRVATIRPLCKWCVRGVTAHGDVCAECAEERRRLCGLGWDARKGNAS